MEVSPQFCVVQQEPEESIFAEEKPELPSMLHTVSAAPAARIQVVTASIVLCGRYRQLSSANDERVAVIMLWDGDGKQFPTHLVLGHRK